MTASRRPAATAGAALFAATALLGVTALLVTPTARAATAAPRAALLDPVTTTAQGWTVVSGWAVPAVGQPAATVVITRDGQAAYRAPTSVARPDVQQQYAVGVPVGFSWQEPTTGTHTYCVTASDATGAGALSLGCGTVTAPDLAGGVDPLAGSGAPTLTGTATLSGFAAAPLAVALARPAATPPSTGLGVDDAALQAATGWQVGADHRFAVPVPTTGGLVRACALVVTAAGTAPAGPWCPPAATTDPGYLVAPDGADAAGSGTSATPFATPQYAVDHVPAGSTITLRAGSYPPFRITTPGLTVRAEVAGAARIVGRAGAAAVVAVDAADTTLAGLAVTGCVPDPAPVGGFEAAGHSSILVTSSAVASTVTGVTVTSGEGVNSYGLPFGCFGLHLIGAQDVTISGDDISGQGTGVFLYGGGQGVRIVGNAIHDNDVIVRNTPTADDDFGGVGITFDGTSGAPGPVASGNTLQRNVGPSHDYGTDGGAFEIFEASDVTMSDNHLADNENVLETGTSAPDRPCAGNAFTGNTVSGRGSGSRLSHSIGIILRCAQGMRITGNTFTGLDWWVFDVTGGDGFSGSVDGLTITDNTVLQGWDKLYALELDPTGHGLTVDRNTYRTSAIFATDRFGAPVADLAAWRRTTGFDAASVMG